MSDFAEIPDDQNPMWHARMAANLLDGMRKHNVDDPQIRALMIAEAQVHATLALRVEIPTATAEVATLSGIVGGGDWIEVGSSVTTITRSADAPRLQGEIGEVIEAHHADGEISYYLVRWPGVDGEISRHAETELALVILPD